MWDIEKTISPQTDFDLKSVLRGYVWLDLANNRRKIPIRELNKKRNPRT
jgi:hypothetical protein